MDSGGSSSAIYASLYWHLLLSAKTPKRIKTLPEVL